MCMRARVPGRGATEETVVAARGSKGSYQCPAGGGIVGGAAKVLTAEQHLRIIRERQRKGVWDTGDLQMDGGHHGRNGLSGET